MLFYEKLAEAKQERERGQRNRLDDIGFNIGAGVLASKGLERGLDASAFSRMNEGARRVRASREELLPILEDDYEAMTKDQIREARKRIRNDDYTDVASTSTHNPLTRLVDKMSGATALRDEHKKLRDATGSLDDVYNLPRAQRSAARASYDEAVALADAAEKKMRSRRLLGRRVAHGVGLGATLLAANKLRNMYNARNQQSQGKAI